MKILDANAILRYVIEDNQEQAKIVAEEIRKGSCTTLEVIAEVVYVLSGVYKIPRHETSWIIHCLMLDLRVEDERSLRYAMGIFDQTSLDFVDCLLIAYHKVLGLDVLSFDKKLNKGMERNFGIYQIPDVK